VAEVRGYVADPNNPFDAIARADLRKPAIRPDQPALSTAGISLRRGRVTQDLTNTGDVLLRTGFDHAAGEAEKSGMAHGAKVAAQ